MTTGGTGGASGAAGMSGAGGQDLDASVPDATPPGDAAADADAAI
jgi:hypothetical protein